MNQPFKGKTALVVGGAGFVGSNLSHMLLDQGIEKLTILDNLLSSDAINVPTDSRVQFVKGSASDQRTLQKLPEDIDYVWHLACYHGNQSSIADPIADHENNNVTSLRLFDYLSTRTNISKVVYAAAGCAVAEKTYGDAAATDEDAPVSLFHDSPYSISKLVGEMYGNYYFRQHDLPFVRARFQNVYGPREILGAGEWRGTPATVWRNVTPTFIWKSLKGEALPLDNGGQVSRDFIFVEDIARGLIACALNGQPGEAYNIASGRETTIAELAMKINALTGNSTPVDMKPARDWDRSGRRFGSTEKSKREIGFEAEVLIDEGLKRTVEWTKTNAALIESRIHKHDYFIHRNTDR
jgi:nucleoside-diphosphate-sugar epimerase